MMILVLILLALVGLPLFAVLALISITLLRSIELEPILLLMEFQRLGELPELAAVPLLIFAGTLLAASRRPKDWLGTAALPASLLAPSLVLILYAVLAQHLILLVGPSPEDMFRAGLGPAMLWLILFGLMSRRIAQGLDPASVPGPGIGQRLRSFSWELPVLGAILLGLYIGWVEILDAAVLMASWLLIVTLWVRRGVTWRQLPALVSAAMLHSAAVLLLLGMSLALARILTGVGLAPNTLYIAPAWLAQPLLFLLISLPGVVVGLLLRPVPAMLVLVPVLMPTVLLAGLEPAQLGIVLLLSLLLGQALRAEYSTRTPGQHENAQRPDRAARLRIAIPALIWLAAALFPVLTLWLPQSIG